MKNVVLIISIAAILPFCSQSFGQDLDSLILPTVNGAPGDTVIMSLLLHNQSFSVGGLRSVFYLPDMAEARFIDVRRGIDVEYFGYFNFAPFTDDTVGVTGIASMPPLQASPLPIGNHEIAIVGIVIEQTATPGAMIPVNFLISGNYSNAISDSSGNLITEPVTIDGGIAVVPSVGIDEVVTTPSIFELKDNYPNPFNAQTTIEYSIIEPGYVSLEIFDLQGRRVRELYDDYILAGNFSVVWDGRTDAGFSVASGIYFYRLSFDNHVIMKKMNLIK
ncbi:MAG: T9SS type A sorting domain-containing protein [candidate division Zixibacteria bacterium]|nr:T9SS type A sorting domain-containing protein [candidate division Zixibacteria bacterium]